MAAFKHTDIRKQGSGSIGASNVWRTYGRWYGVPVVVLDAVKGFVPAFVFAHTVSPLAGVLAGAAAMLGHARPLFLKFEKGGKMVATCGGAFLGVAWLVGLIGVAVWIVVFVLTRYASVASLVAAVALPTAAALLGRAVAGDRVRGGVGSVRDRVAPRERQAAAPGRGEPLQLAARKPYGARVTT